MKPRKPRIVRANLVWKWTPHRKAWEPYHVKGYTEAGKRKQASVFLDWQGDPQRLDELYWQARAGRHERQVKPPEYSWRQAVIEWRSDPRVQGRIADGTRKSYRREMDALLEKNADKDMRRTTRQGVRAVHTSLADTPRKADWRVQVISLLWNYACKKLDWPLGDNPASGIDLFGKQREYEPWPEWMIERLPEAPDSVQAAAELILGTGQRPSAAVTMRYDQFAGDTMTVTDEKGGVSFEVFCPDRLRLYIADRRKGGAHVIPRNLTQPVGYSAVEKAFRAWRSTMPEASAYTLHGLRKLAIVQLAESGASDAEIQAVTNQSAEMAAFYRKRANRKKLSKAAQMRRDR